MKNPRQPGRESGRLGHDHASQQGSGNRAGDAVERKRGGSAIGHVVPGAIEAGFRTDLLASRNRAVVRSVGNHDIPATLRVISVPDLRDCLSIGKRELQTPAVDGGRPRVGNGEIDPEPTSPLTADRIMDATTHSRGRGRRRRRRRGRCGSHAHRRS